MIKISKELILFSLIAIVVLLSYLWFKETPFFEDLFLWSQQNLITFFIFLALIKFVSILYPPLPGGLFSLGSIPLIGWELAFAADSIGSIFGGAINYHIAKKFGMPLIKRLIGEDISEKIALIKIKNNKEFEAVFFARIFFGTTLLEVIHYAAGMLNINFTKYILAIVTSQVVMGFVIFYLLGGALQGNNVYWVVLPLLIAIPLFYKYRHRYLDV